MSTEGVVDTLKYTATTVTITRHRVENFVTLTKERDTARNNLLKHEDSLEELVDKQNFLDIVASGSRDIVQRMAKRVTDLTEARSISNNPDNHQSTILTQEQCVSLMQEKKEIENKNPGKQVLIVSVYPVEKVVSVDAPDPFDRKVQMWLSKKTPKERLENQLNNNLNTDSILKNDESVIISESRYQYDPECTSFNVFLILNN